MPGEVDADAGVFAGGEGVVGVGAVGEIVSDGHSGWTWQGMAWQGIVEHG